MARGSNILPNDWQGILKPNVVIFEDVVEKIHVALITAVHQNGDDFVYSVAVTRSGYGKEGQPLSLLQSALGREKFGQESWRKLLDSNQGKEKVGEQLSVNLKRVIERLSVKRDGKFDLGLIMSLKD